MPLVSTALNQRSVLALVACDLSYTAEGNLENEVTPLATFKDSDPEANLFPVALATEAGINSRQVQLAGKTEIALGDWILKERQYDPTTGFSALFFYSTELNEYIVALTGTNGPDGQDWYNNLNLSTTQWNEQNRQRFGEILGELETANPQFSTSRITFTGQSLGGALAQFAAYQFVEEFVEENPAFSSSQISLITFNGLGAFGGMNVLRPEGFDPDLLADVETAHYVVTNDIVSRLGEGNFNAAGHTFLLDFRVFPGQERALGIVEAHRIETGFYRGFDWGQSSLVARDLGWGSFRTAARSFDIDYLDVSNVQELATGFSQLFNDDDHSEFESWARLIAGLAHGLRKVPQDELEAATAEFIEHARRASLSAESYALWFAATKVVPVALKGLAASPGGVSASGWALLLGILWDVGEDQVGSSGNMRERLSSLLPASEYDMDVAQSIVAESDFAHSMFKALIGFKISDGTLLKGVSLDYDPSQVLTTVFAGSDWLKPTLRFFTERARDAGASVPEVAMAVAESAIGLAKSLGVSAGALLAEVVSETSVFVADIGNAIANAHQDFVTKIVDTVFDLQRSFGFTEGRSILDEFKERLKTFADKDVREAVKDAIDTIEAAGQTIMVKPSAEVNPFNDSAFDPDTAPVSDSTATEGSARSYTAFLSYEAGEGGQHIRMKLEGSDTDDLKVIAGGQTLTVVNGEFDLVVAEGQRELTFALVQRGDIDTDGGLTLSATLIDDEGNATHQTHVELNLTLDATEEGAFEEPSTTNAILGDQDPAGNGNLKDILGGTAANDLILAGLDDDDVSGFGGDDVIDAGDGDDTVRAHDGDDHILGGAGNDYLRGDAGKDHVEGGAGDDLVIGGDGDYLSGEDDDDLLEGGSGNDIVSGEDGDDQLFSGTQADSDAAFDDDSELQATEGTEWLIGGYGDDVLIGGTGIDILVGGGHADVLAGAEGDDFLFGDRHAVTTVSVVGFSPLLLDEIDPEGGDDALFGGAGDDLLFGEIGNDALFGGAGDDELIGDNDDLEAEQHGNDYLDGGAGADGLKGGGGNDDLIGGDGDDELFGDSDDLPVDEHGDDYLEGDAGDDLLQGGGGNDILIGGTGDDLLLGEQGDDELYGSEGVDELDGNEGDDYVDGGVGNDLVFGGLGQDTLFGGDGDDQLMGDLGGANLDAGEDDWLEGGAGNDVLFGQGGDDTLFGDEGEDQLVGGAGDDYLDGGEGDDTQMLGGDGDDTLAGGQGTDVLDGGAGQDTYLFERGDSSDVVLDTGDREASVITFGAGISLDDIHLALGQAVIDLGEGPNRYTTLVLDLGGGDAIHVAGLDPSNPAVSDLFDYVSFADGTSVTYQSLLEQGVEGVDVDGTDDEDILTGTGANDLLDGNGGDDELYGYLGKDALDGGEGDDALSGGEGDDALHGDAGADALHGGSGADALEGGDGDDMLLGADGDDTLAGGAGDDVLVGNEGSDIYTFGLGDGKDVVDEQADTSDTDIVRFDASVASAGVTLLRGANGDLVVRYGVSDELRIVGQYAGAAQAIEGIEFADGTVIDSAALEALPIAPITGTSGDDTLTGTSSADEFAGLAGADTYSLRFGMSKDTIVDASPSTAEVSTLELGQWLTLDSLTVTRQGDDLAVDIRGTPDGVLIKDYFSGAEQHWQIAEPDGALTALEDLVDLPDPYADDEALAAREAYRQSTLSGWSRAQSFSPPLPTHAWVESSWSQTTTTFYLEVNGTLVPHVIVQAASSTFDIYNYSTFSGREFSPVSFVSWEYGLTTTSQVSDDEVITTQGTPATSTEDLIYGVRTLNSIPGYGSYSYASTSSIPTSATSFNTTDSRESGAWKRLMLTPGGGGPSEVDTLTILKISYERVVEDIVAGDSDNTIYGSDGAAAGHVVLIDAGGGNDTVFAGDADFVYGNDGDDVIYGGALVYGGNGADTVYGGSTAYGGSMVYGGAGDDHLAHGYALYGGGGDDYLTGSHFLDGGSGDDYLVGLDGATRFHIEPDEFGADFIEDVSGIDLDELTARYLDAEGIGVSWQSDLDPEDFQTLGGLWGVSGYTFEALIDMGWDLPEGYEPRAAILEVYDDSVPGIVFYASLDDLRADLAAIGLSYYEEDVWRAQSTRGVTANDYRRLEPFYELGVIEQDTVAFGAGVSLADLTMGWSTTEDHAVLELSWGAGHSISVVIPRSDDLIGTGIERFTFDDETVLSMAEMLALAPPAPPVNTIEGSPDFADELAGTAESDLLRGLSGDDVIAGGGGDDVLTGGDGDDELDGETGSDRYQFGVSDNGIDQVSDGAANTLDYFDWYYEQHGVAWRWGEAFQHAGEYRVFRGGYYPTLAEAEEHAGDGQPIRLVAPPEDVAPVVRRDDTVMLQQLIEAGVLDKDVVELGAGLALEDLSLEIVVDVGSVAAHPEQPWYDGGILRVRWNGGESGFDLEVPDVNYGEGDDLGLGVEVFRFADGTELWLEEILQQAEVVEVASGLYIEGTEDDDDLVGTDGSDTLVGLDGDDWLEGLEGHDTLIGGPGDDDLEGGAGADLYLFTWGDGFDYIYDYDDNFPDSSGEDVVRFDASIAPQDVRVTRDMWSLYLVIGEGLDVVVLSDALYDEAARIERVEFANGEVWSHDDLVTRVETLPATEHDDILWGSDEADTIEGLGGYNVIVGNGGDDVLIGGADSDDLYGGEGHDIVRGGDGDDYIEDADSGSDLLEGGAEGDSIYASGNDLVIGGTGSDWIDLSGAGAIVAINAGDDGDTIDAADAFTLSLGGGIGVGDLALVAAGGGGVLLRIGEDDYTHIVGYSFQQPSITLQMFGSGSVHTYDFSAVIDAYFAARDADPELIFMPLDGVLQAYETGSSETEALGGAIAHRYATTGSTSGLSAAQIQSVLADADFGLAPQSIQVAGNAAPTLDDAVGDQRAFGGVAFSFMVPADAFSDADGDELAYSVTLADGSALPGWLSFDAQTRTFSGTPAQGDAGSLQVTVRVSDGGASAEDTFSLTVVQAIVGTDGEDNLEGTEEADYILAGDGYDLVRGNGGDDTIVGGGDEDELLGGLGDDTYVYNSGDGLDFIFDDGGFDTIEFGAGIGPDDVLLQTAYGYLIVGVGGLNEIWIEEGFDADYRVDQLTFADGTVWDAAEIESRVSIASGTPLDDAIYGDAGDNVLDGLAGDDQIGGGGGNDILSGGDGDDSLMGNAGRNLLIGGAGGDTFYVEDASGTLVIGGVGDDGIQTGTNGSVIAFNAGDGEDTLYDAFYGVGVPLVLSVGGVSISSIVLTIGEYGVRIGLSDTDGITSYAYGGDPADWASGKLQIIGSDIRVYDLNAVMQDFYTAGAPEEWVAAGSLESHLLSVSTTEAFGGAIAYQYATTGNVNALSLSQKQLVIAEEAFGVAAQAIQVAGNSAPVLDDALADQAAAEDAAFSFTVPADAFSDADADELAYTATLQGGAALPAWLSFDAQTRTFSGTPLQAHVGNIDVTVTASDGELSAEDTFTLTVNNVNDTPVVSATNATLLFDASAAASSLFSVFDEDGQAPAQYEFWDSTAGNGHWMVGGVEQGVNVSIAVSADDLDDTTFTAGSTFGSDQVWARAYDGEAWSTWKSWYVASAPHETNAAPVVSAEHAQLLLDDSVAASSLFAVTDADNDAIVGYEFWDDVAGGGYFSLDGIAQSNNPIPVGVADLAGLEYVAGATPGTEQVWVRASDGMAWSAWKPWNMTSALHIPNAAPAVSVTNATVLLGQSVDAETFFSASDADGDPVASYEFWDSTAGNGHFTVGGVEQGVNVGIVVTAAELADVEFVGSASTGSDLVWVRANDSQSWGEWKSWTVNSWPHATNAKPVADAPNVSILTNQVVEAGSLFAVTDADGDTITQYEFWDDVAGGGYFRVDGVQQGAVQAIAVSDLESVEYVGGAAGGTEQVWVRANDGLEWSAWEAWNIETALHIPNAVPVVTASNATVLLDGTVQASSFFAVTDGDADPITKYEFWDSTAGNGHFAVNGVQAGVNVAIAVTAAQLADTQFHAASGIGSDLVWVRANDGQNWSDWKSWYVQSSPHLTNAAPVVTAAVNGVLRNEAVSAASLFSVSDADTDAITQYELWDDVNGGGHWEVDGVQQAAASTIAVSAGNLANTTYVGGANAGTEQVWARAYDGMAWSAWKNWLMSTEGGMLRGGLGPDSLVGEAGPTVLEGGGGDDDLTDTEGNNVLSGGQGDDSMTGGAGNDLFVGGEGDDTAYTGEGYNLIAYNQGGGLDTVYSAAGASNTLSLGGGLGYNDLSLSRDGDDLLVNTGGDNRIALKDWYAGKDNVANLQLVLDGDYDAGSADPLHNRRVQSFDFLGMVAQFDAALAQSPGLSSWAMTNALLQAHLAASDDAAIGGDLAYWYGRNGALTGISLNAAQQVLGAANFGADAQTLRPFEGLQEGMIKLG